MGTTLIVILRHLWFNGNKIEFIVDWRDFVEAYLEFNISSMMVIMALLFSASFSLILMCFIIIKSRKSKMVNFFILGQGCFFVWTLFYIFELLAPNMLIRWLVISVEYIAISYIGVNFYVFSRYYCGRPQLSIKKMIILYLPSTFFIVSVWTNPLHNQFYTGWVGNIPQYGVLCWALIIETFIFLSGGLILFIKEIVHSDFNRRKQGLFFVFAAVIPGSVHLLYATEVIKANFTVTLVFLPFSLLIIAISVLKYRFLNIIPFVIESIIENMEEGFIVFNNDGKIDDCSIRFFSDYMDIELCTTITEFTQMLSLSVSNEAMVSNIQYTMNVTRDNYMSGEIELIKHNKKHLLSYTARAINDIYGIKQATIITFHDLTVVKALHDELASKNNELKDANDLLEIRLESVANLAQEHEREKLMLEIHDTLGHTMAELLAMLEVCDMLAFSENEDESKYEIKIEETLERARVGLKEIRQSVSRFKKMGAIR